MIELDLINILILIVLLINLVYGLTTYSRNRKSKTNIVFFLLTFTVAFWQFSMIMYRSAEIFEEALRWAKILYVSAPTVTFSLLYFSFVFPDKDYKFDFFKKYIIPIPYIITIFFALHSDSLIKSVRIEPGNENFIFFNFEFYALFGLYLAIYFGWSFLNFFKKYIKTSGVEKVQLRFIIIGTLLSTGVAMITNYLFMYWGNFELQWLGQIGIIIMISSIFYAILKHHLFDIKVIATEIFTFILWVVLFIQVLGSESPTDKIINIAVLLATILIGILLMRSVYKEVRQREELERLTVELRKANEKLKELDRLKTEFLSLASHQFRSPLTAIKGYASLILEGSYGEVNESVKEAVTNIFKSSSNLADVVQDFLDVSRIEQGRMKYDMDEVDFRDIVEEITAELKPNITGSGLKFNIEVEKGKDYRIKGDASRLKQIIINIVDNAQKYTEEGSITVGLERVNDKIKFIVEDTGSGIAKDEIPKLFGKFRRAKGANEVNVKGTGLGLYLVKKIVEDHKGQIEVRSGGVGKGAKFIVTLDALN